MGETSGGKTIDGGVLVSVLCYECGNPKELAMTLRVLIGFSTLLMSAQAHGARPRVAVIADGPSELFNAHVSLLADEVDALIGTDSWSFPRQPTAVGDFSRPSVEALVQNTLADRSVDWVVGVGALVGAAVAAQKTLPKPVFIPIAAPTLQGLPRDENRSGKRNLVYLTGLLDIDVELRRLAQLGGAEPVMLVGANLEALIRDHRATQARADRPRVRIIPASGGAEEILAAIPEDAGAVYIGVLPRLPFSDIDRLIAGLNARRLPTYAGQGRAWVERGAFLTLVPGDEHLRRMRQMALYMSDALRGEPLAAMNVIFEPRAELVINMATAREIGVYPRFELLTEAEQVGIADRGRGRHLSLRDAVSEALAANLALRARMVDIEIAEERLAAAWSEVMPRVDAVGDFDWLDPDVAVTSPERTLSWGLSARQVVFSAAAIQAIAAQKHLRKSADHTVHATELDTVRDAAIAYLNVLRTRTAERISRENLRRTRRNLSLAEVRSQIGVAAPAEVFRWQAEIADARANLISATAVRNQAEIALNQLMNRPLEEPFAPVEPAGSADYLILDPRMSEHVDNRWRFKVLRAFMVEEAQANAPELRELDELIASQERVSAALTQRLFLPDVFASAGFTNTLDRAGKGVTPPPGFPQDDLTWQVGVGLQLNLFDYGRYAEINEVDATLSQLRTRRSLAAQQIEQRVRNAMHQVGFSRAAVLLRQDAAEAALQNLGLVTDAYRQGSVDIITLVDAQNQAFVAEQAAANAGYDFLADYIEAERAAGAFGFRRSEEERDALFQKMLEFERQTESNGGTP
jgi:outer membrane protein TolC